MCYTLKMDICPAYFSKHYSYRAKQVILIMISNGEWLHYLVEKKLSVLLREITSNNNGGFCCLNCLHSFRTKTKLESNKKVC